MKNTLLTFLLGATAISSSMTGEALATSLSYGGVAVQNAPLMTFPKGPFKAFGINNTALMDKQIANIVTAFEIQIDFNSFMEGQRKALEGFSAKNEQIKDDEILARHLQSQYDAEFARSLAEQDGISLHEAALENFAIKNEQIKDDELLARHLQSQYDAEFVRSLAESEQEEAVVPVVKTDSRGDLLSSIKGFNASNLKKAVVPVVKVARRSLPIVPTSLKKIEEVPQHIQREFVPVQKEVKSAHIIEESTDFMDVLARQVSGFSQQNVNESIQAAEEALFALRLAIADGDIEELEDNALIVVEKALKEDRNKLSWFVSEFYDENEGWDFGFFEEDEIMKKMATIVPREDEVVADKPLSQQRVGRVNKLTLQTGSDLSLLEQIRMARGVVEAEEDSGFVKAPVVKVAEEVEDQPVVIKQAPAKKVAVKVLDDGNHSGNLLSAISGFSFAKLNKVNIDEIEEKVDASKNHLEMALAARRGAIAGESDDEEENWDDF